MVSTNQIVNKGTVDLFNFDEFVLFVLLNLFIFNDTFYKFP